MILKRSITALQTYSEKNGLYADAIALSEGTYLLEELLHEALWYYIIGFCLCLMNRVSQNRK